MFNLVLLFEMLMHKSFNVLEKWVIHSVNQWMNKNNYISNVSIQSVVSGCQSTHILLGVSPTQVVLWMELNYDEWKGMKFPGCQMRLVAFYSAIKWNSPIVTIVPFVTNGYFFFVLLCSSTFVPLNYAKCVPFWIQLWRWHHLSLVLKRRWDSSSSQLQPTYSSLTFLTLNLEITFMMSRWP